MKETQAPCPECGIALPGTDIRLVYHDWVKEVPIVHTSQRCELAKEIKRYESSVR